MSKPRRKWPRPYVNLWIDVWILQVRTEIMNESYEAQVTRWIVLEITILHRHGFSFKLYAPHSHE